MQKCAKLCVNMWNVSQLPGLKSEAVFDLYSFLQSAGSNSTGFKKELPLYVSSFITSVNSFLMS